MKQLLSAGLVKQSLAGHSWLGVMVGALMYLVCLSGTLAVFYKEFERWEQPGVAESMQYDPAAIDRAYNDHVRNGGEITHDVFISLPTPDAPRTTLSTANQGWFVNQDGSRGEAVSRDWTHMLVNLHLYLHLPQNIGLILVGALGALLCGLIVSGILAHPRIFKDAFALRLGGSRLLEQADIHNRLSVWSLPFQLMIAITGAYFGLAQLLGLAMAGAYFDGDTTALSARLYGAEPSLQQPQQPLAVERALRAMPGIAPGATPFYVTVERADEPANRYMLVGAEFPGRLIYAEQYRFDSAGNYLDKVGYSDGEAGRQAIFSTYRLHFGHFSGFAVKVLYGVLGLAMTIVCVTGFNVWLARRKRHDALSRVWAGFIWGAAPGLALAAMAQIVFGRGATAVFWLTLVATSALGVAWRDERTTKRRLELGGCVAVAALVLSHAIRFGTSAASGVALWINVSLMATAALLLFVSMKRATPAATADVDLAARRVE